MAKPEQLFLYGAIESPFTWTTGRAVGVFLTHLKNDREILGLKCSKCGTVFVPPQDYCEDCFDLMDEWVKVEPRGEIVGFCIVHHTFSGQPCDPPYAYALIKLNGADTNLVHLIRAPDLSKISVGDKVEAVFAKETKGFIWDINYFRPL